MATAKERVPVVRVSRHYINQIIPQENQDYQYNDTLNSHLTPYNQPHLDKTHLTSKDQYNVPRTKSDEFTLTVPRTSDRKSDDSNRQSDRMDSLRPSMTIQKQPTPTNTWMKRTSEHDTHPNLYWKSTGKWTHGLCSLFDDFNMCCYACSCWCCFRHELSSMMNEHWCLWFINCSPLMELRTKFRQQYGIRGSIAEDFCLSTCCPLCVALQIANEGRSYGHRIFN